MHSVLRQSGARAGARVAGWRESASKVARGRQPSAGSSKAPEVKK